MGTAFLAGHADAERIMFTDDLPAAPLPREADTLGGYTASHFAAATDVTTLEGSVNTLSINMLPAGTVITCAGTTVPTGFLECNGSILNRETYFALFDKIGTTYNAGNGTTTFGIPDLRGEFVRGWDHGRGADTGRAIGTWQIGTATHTTGYNSRPYNSTNVENEYPLTTGTGFFNNNGSSNPGAVNYGYVRPRNVAMMYCIKY